MDIDRIPNINQCDERQTKPGVYTYNVMLLFTVSAVKGGEGGGGEKVCEGMRGRWEGMRGRWEGSEMGA